jgi:hypothetical protein
VRAGRRWVRHRFCISSLAMEHKDAGQWQMIVRLRWYRTFGEDGRPWLHRSRGMVVMMLLRRLTYSVLAIYRSLTKRSESKGCKRGRK